MVPIQVFLISDFRLLRTAVEATLAEAPLGFALAGHAEDGEQAMTQLAQTRVDVILLDIDGNADSIPPLITTLRALSDAKILLLTRLDNIPLQDQAVMFGARGIVDRNIAPESLRNAIAKIHEGQVWLDRTATARIFVELSRLGSTPAPRASVDPVDRQLAQLTEREQEIVATVSRHSGEPAKALARKLHISESTLRNHLTSIYEKLGVSNRNGLLAYALQHRLAERLPY